MKTHTVIIITITLTLLLAAGVGVYYIYMYVVSEGSAAAETAAPETSEDELLAPRDVPTGFSEYRNTRFRFSLFYPEGMQVETFNEGGSAMTITFTDTEAGQGFQVFVVRYREPQVTEERFRKDVPSGVREDMREVVIDGATGASFFSESATLGATAEVWFVHNDYLYEITAPKALAEWLSDIMQSWRFL